MRHKASLLYFSLAITACFTHLLVQPLPIKAEEEDHTIVPGTGVGIVKLGMQRDQIRKAIGKPDGVYSLPAGIAVDYSQWQDPNITYTIRIFYDPSGKAIQIAVRAPVPATADGISLKSSLTEVTNKYPHLRPSLYKAKDAAIEYYDDLMGGITFEFTRAQSEPESAKRLYAILIHQRGRHLIPDDDERHLVSKE